MVGMNAVTFSLGRFFDWATPLSLQASWLRDMVPATLKGADHALLSIEFWQWIGLFSVIVIGLAVDVVARVVLGHITGRQLKEASPGTHT